MRIESAPYVVNLSGAQAVRKQPPEAAPVQGTTQPRMRVAERVEISPQARELQKLKQDLGSLPDLRPDRVALAKQNLQYGRYRVDPSAVAQSMIDSVDSNYLKGDVA